VTSAGTSPNMTSSLRGRLKQQQLRTVPSRRAG
jgi:hypothetical protein